MNIVLWGTYDTGKPRIRILRDGLRESGATVMEIHAPIWEGVEDKSGLRASRWLRRGFRLLLAYPGLIIRYLRAPAHDVVLVSYPGQLDLLVLHLFACLRRKPIVFDWFISAYDTLVYDRRMLARTNPVAWLVWLAEWLAARAATVAFMDTATHARRIEQLFHLRPESIGRVWVGAEARFFDHAAGHHASCHDVLQVLYYGQFIPLHGVETIIRAARILRNEPVRIRLVGRGQHAARIRGMLDTDPLNNVVWDAWIPYADLPAALAEVDVCLGIFGASAKAASVIPNKVFQVVAAGKPLVTRDSGAIRELLDIDGACTQLIHAGDARALANALRACTLKKHGSESAACHRHAQTLITPLAIAHQFDVLVRHTLAHPGRDP